MVRHLPLLALFALASCCRVSPTLDICLEEPLHPVQNARENCVPLTLPSTFSLSPFTALSPEERETDWGKELHIALCFAADFDLFRAVTGFKRALFLLPAERRERRLEIEYDIALAYYLGKKYPEALFAVESCELLSVTSTFAAFHDLLLLLYDCRKQLGQEVQAEHLLTLIHRYDANEGEKLTLLSALERGQLETLPSSSYGEIISSYHCQKKSIAKASRLNAVLPGAGYWYVGQKQTAVTAFLINALFLGAATECFLHGHHAAGAIVLTLESGWYFGGIYGGGLAAKYYNERLYETYAQRIASREKLFPIMMLKYTF